MPRASAHSARRPQSTSGRVAPGGERAEEASERGQDQPLGQVVAAQASRGEAERLEEPHLAEPLLEAEAEEEAGQQQAGHDQEEREVREVLAEVGRAAGGVERVASDRHDGRRGPRRARARLALAQVREQALRESPAGVFECRARRRA